MAYARKYYRRRARKYLRRPRTTRKGTKVSTRVKRYVKNMIHRQIENKERILYAANTLITSGDRTSTTWPLLAGFSQGTDNYSRIGNAIKIVRGQMKVCINLLPYDATNNNLVQPTWVRVMVVRDLKTAGQQTTMDASAYARIFRGNGTGLGFQGTPLDMTLPVNKDYFRPLYDKVFKLGCAGVYNVAPVSTNVNSFQDNSSATKMLTINFGKWAKKLLKFDDGNTQVINDNLYFVIQPVCMDGTGTTGKIPIEMHYTIVSEFEDA